jgi:hypothetical protein
MGAYKLLIHLDNSLLTVKERAWLKKNHDTYEASERVTVMKDGAYEWVIAVWPESVTRLTGGEKDNEQWLHNVLGYEASWIAKFKHWHGDLFLVILGNGVAFIYATCLSADLVTIRLVGKEGE